MHYRHACHAGNFADVFKHVLLLGLIESLNRKPKPWCFLDTHAGAGQYDLMSPDASRTQEWQSGVGALRPSPRNSSWVQQYLEIVGRPPWTSNNGNLKEYPGSPAWVSTLSRHGDRIICCETEARIFGELRTRLPNAIVHQRSGYESSGLLPPGEKRGLILVDPPYEDRMEWQAINSYLDKCIKRFSNGIYAVWYPIKSRHEVDRFLRRCRNHRKSALCEISTGARGEGQMRACGLVVINPPYGFAQQARESLTCLAPQLAQGPRPSWTVDEA